MDDGQRAVMTTEDDHEPVAHQEPDEGDWTARAACAGTATPDVFFPDHDDEAKHAALALCAGCPVRVPCLHYALLNRERYGVWGGMTAQEREVLVYGDPSTLRGPGRVA